MLQSKLVLTLSRATPEREFHHPHRAHKDDDCEYGVGVLMEGWVLQVVVVERYEYCEGDEEESEEEAEEAGARVGECGIGH